MPTFGQHETALRLYLSGVGGFYALKSDETRVIKVLQPPEGIWKLTTLSAIVRALALPYHSSSRVSGSGPTPGADGETGGICVSPRRSASRDA